MCLYVLYKTCAGVNIDPMGQTLKKNIDIKQSRLVIGTPGSSDFSVVPISDVPYSDIQV